MPEDNISHINFDELKKNAISQPIVKHIYTADPSAHVFDGKIYIYPSHDIDAGDAFDDLGSHFAMEDYHILSLDAIDTDAKDNGIALHVNEVPWAEKQMWAPDAAHKDGKYYLFFPAKDYEGIFRIGVAISDTPIGPFTPQAEAIKNSFSIDPAVFKDNNNYYMYFGGIWGGQLQRWKTGKFNEAQPESPLAFLPHDNEPALCAKVAKLSNDLLSFEEHPKDVIIIDENGEPLLQGDKDRRFFEASWMHKYNGKYYFSYSTGDTHFICYAISDNLYGPFVYQGKILEPVVGWTSHHSICEFNGTWYLFYHDSSLSKGVTHLRSVKVTELIHDGNGKIQLIEPYKN
jgi:hypothetical protein